MYTFAIVGHKVKVYIYFWPHFVMKFAWIYLCIYEYILLIILPEFCTDFIKGSAELIGSFPSNQNTFYLLCLFYSDNEIITERGRPAISTLIGWLVHVCLFPCLILWGLPYWVVDAKKLNKEGTGLMVFLQPIRMHFVFLFGFSEFFTMHHIMTW